MLITGATGFIGSRLATVALARGYTVKTLTRSDWSGPPRVDVQHRSYGVLPDRIPPNVMQGVAVVVHCAAWVKEGEESAFAVNVKGTMRLVELARKAGVQTFIFLSSQSARLDAFSAYGRSKYAAEQALLSESGTTIVILRPGLVTGPGGTQGLYGRLCRLVESLPVIPLLGGGRSIVQPIHVDDLCAAIFRCDESKTSFHHAVLRLGDPGGVTLAEFVRAIAQVRLGRPKMTISIPLWPVEIAVWFFESLGISLPITSGNLKGLKSVEKMDTAADMARLNLILRPLNEMLLN
jgi:nucleoside-diphosphate-sugar epimerase